MTVSEAVREVLVLLEIGGGDYVLVGGVAAIHHGIPRFTKDADFVVSMSTEALTRFLAGMPSCFHVHPQACMELFTGTMRWIVNVPAADYDMEFFLLGKDPHHAEEFRRRQRVRLPLVDRDAWLATAEDIIIQKLRWLRLKDRQDIEGILGLKGADLDFAYIEKWCAIHGTQARLDELRRSIPPDL